jgi:hypothetical protein
MPFGFLIPGASGPKPLVSVAGPVDG